MRRPGVGIRQRQNQVGDVGAGGSQEPASRGLAPQDGGQDSQPQGGVTSPQPASKARSDGSGCSAVRPPDPQHRGRSQQESHAKYRPPPPTRALAVPLEHAHKYTVPTTWTKYSPSSGHRAEKCEARRLSQCVKNTDVTDQGDHGSNSGRNRGRRSERSNHRRDGEHGRILLVQALEQGHEVTALARNPAAVAPRDYRPRVLEGNALDPEAVEAAVEGQDAVLSALGTRSRKPTTLFSASTANLVAAMKKHGVRRLVCLTELGLATARGTAVSSTTRVILPFVVNNQYEAKSRDCQTKRSGVGDRAPGPAHQRIGHG